MKDWQLGKDRQYCWHWARVPDPTPITLFAPHAKPNWPQISGSGVEVVAVAIAVEVVVSAMIAVDVMRSVTIAVSVLVVR